MNLFDVVAGLTLVVSALIGLSRGAVLEIVALFAFTAAATVSVYLLPFTTPIALSTVRPAWAANAVAAAVSFLVAYIGLRLLGSSVSQAVKGHATLGPLDRTMGLAFGVTRALVVLGVVFLVFSATPAGRPPELLTSARLYPLARGSGLMLASLAPGGMQKLEAFGQSLRSRMAPDQPAPPAGPVEAGQPDAPQPAQAEELAPAPPSLQIDNGSPPRRHHHRPPDAPVE